MAKRIVMYNLAPNVTHEEFKEYVQTDKGPRINGLPAVKRYELVKISSSMPPGNIPYQYVGIIHLTSVEDFNNIDSKKPEYQAFLKKFGPLVTDMVMLAGDEIY